MLGSSRDRCRTLLEYCPRSPRRPPRCPRSMLGISPEAKTLRPGRTWSFSAAVFQACPGFDGAAPARPGISQDQLPPASPSCCDKTTAKVSHPHSRNQRPTAHSDVPERERAQERAQRRGGRVSLALAPDGLTVDLPVKVSSLTGLADQDDTAGRPPTTCCAAREKLVVNPAGPAAAGCQPKRPHHRRHHPPRPDHHLDPCRRPPARTPDGPDDARPPQLRRRRPPNPPAHPVPRPRDQHSRLRHAGGPSPTSGHPHPDVAHDEQQDPDRPLAPSDHQHDQPTVTRSSPATLAVNSTRQGHSPRHAQILKPPLDTEWCQSRGHV